MHFDPENPVNKLCAQGMLLEGEAKPAEAATLFRQAWQIAANATEKFTAAHYLARQQASVADKLHWDETALKFAQEVNDPEIAHVYPSLYLNIAKCYEDLGNLVLAMENYQLALRFAGSLPDDGYSHMIRSGIASGIKRVTAL